jgi:hypothetical protein
VCVYVCIARRHHLTASRSIQYIHCAPIFQQRLLDAAISLIPCEVACYYHLDVPVAMASSLTMGSPVNTTMPALTRPLSPAIPDVSFAKVAADQMLVCWHAAFPKAQRRSILPDDMSESPAPVAAAGRGSLLETGSPSQLVGHCVPVATGLAGFVCKSGQTLMVNGGPDAVASDWRFDDDADQVRILSVQA